MEPEVAHIYGLFDPRIPDVIWYVGKTNNARTRLQYYRKDKSTTPVYKWFRRLQAEGSEPKLRVLETCPFGEWKDCERAAIALHRKKNLLLLNIFDGGNGTAVKGRKEFCECGEARIRLHSSDTSLRCPICRKAERIEYYKSYYAAHKEEQKQAHAAYYQGNRVRVLEATASNQRKQIKAGLCASIGCQSVPVVNRKRCRFHLDINAARLRNRYKALKSAVQ